MNRLSFALITTMLCITMAGTCQLNNFDLAKYKLPNMRTQLLETNFNLTGQNNFAKQFPDNEFESRKTTAFRNDINLNYYHYLNNAKYQSESSASFNLSGGFNSSETKNQNSNSSFSFSPYLKLKSNNRKYNNEIFVGFGLDANLQIGSDNHSVKLITTNDEYKNKAFNATNNIAIPLSAGVGRIEQVQDARQAVYIFDELTKTGSVTQNITYEQVIEFAQLISQLKKKRSFDSRIKRMEDIESIDSFFVANNFITPKHDAKYFTTLADFWDYGNTPIRESGQRLSLIFSPGYYFSSQTTKSNNTTEYDNTLNSAFATVGLEFKYKKPVNLLWQNSFDISALFEYLKGWDENNLTLIEIKHKTPGINLNYLHTIGYYPNTRTNLTFSYMATYVKLFGESNYEELIYGIEGQGALVAGDFNFNYYISPRFRLNFSFDINYRWIDNKYILTTTQTHLINYLLTNANNQYTKNFSTGFNLRLVYSIF